MNQLFGEKTGNVTCLEGNQCHPSLERSKDLGSLELVGTCWDMKIYC